MSVYEVLLVLVSWQDPRYPLSQHVELLYFFYLLLSLEVGEDEEKEPEDDRDERLTIKISIGK